MMDARLAILGHFSAASLATGPLMSVPFRSPSGVIMTAALSSKTTLCPLTLLTGYFCLTITAPKTVFFRSGGPFFTTQTIESPTDAAGILLHLPLYLVTWTTLRVLAPVLSAQLITA